MYNLILSKGSIMKSSLIKAFLILPGTALVFIPGVLLYFSKNSMYSYTIADGSDPKFWIGILLLIIGLVLAAWTVRLQFVFGKGTPAPWDPPKKLVIEGPYKYVRNPMITGALLILAAESLLLGSWSIAWWMAIFLIMNMIYFPFFEERELENRFGEEYRKYKQEVPRWIPKISDK
ncbi:MAG: isoprenylcysteine carboxylmethyltransferase family protein [Candidatus Heimdallarchaeota archaeon]|nr:isoprenylcysteine carboxylmethyltransferase family protein [Candidatus Heimdallarchaeota archaeon]